MGRRVPRHREGLLDAARDVLLDSGIDALTVDDITARAGVAKGTFYLYFRSKQQVLAALQERFAEQVMARQAAELNAVSSGDWLGMLELWMESSVRFYLDSAHLHEALFNVRDLGSQPSFADASTNPHVRSLQEILEAGNDAGAFSLQSATTATVLLYSAMHGAAHHLVSKAPARAADHEVGEVVQQLRLLCRRYLAPTENR